MDAKITFRFDPKSKPSKTSGDEVFFMDGVDEMMCEEEHEEQGDVGSNELLELEHLMEEELIGKTLTEEAPKEV